VWGRMGRMGSGVAVTYSVLSGDLI
jgi:hypothetical protein